MTSIPKRFIRYLLAVLLLLALLIGALAAFNPLGDTFCYDVPGDPHYTQGNDCL